MSWVNVPAKVTSLTIDGIEYVDEFLSFTLTDESFNQNGIVTTSGVIELANLPADYERRHFSMGETVLISVSKDAGPSQRHPRGYLFVLSSVYSPDTETVVIDVGCQLALKELLGDIQGLTSYIPTELTTGQNPAIPPEDLEDLDDTQIIRQALAQTGQLIYADKNNVIQKVAALSGVGSSQMVSIKGVTTELTEPLNNEPVPDSIDITYTYLEGDAIIDNDEILNTEITTYPIYLNIPRLQRVPPDQLKDTTPRPSQPKNVYSNVSCGGSLGTIDVPPPVYEPGDDGESCSGGFLTTNQVDSFTATITNTARTEYRGFARQQSRGEVIQQATGYEINSGYYDDYLAFCINSFASACNPNGSCYLPASARGVYRQSLTITTYEYNLQDGGLVKTIEERFLNNFSALQPSDWRAGVNVDGTFNTFRTINPDDAMFLASRTETTISPYGNGTDTIETIWQSPLILNVSARSPGSSQFRSTTVKPFYRKTTRRVLSFSSQSRPDTTAIAADGLSGEVKEKIYKQPIYSQRGIPLYPYKIDASLPISSFSQKKSSSWAAIYGDYLRQLVQGESLGITIAETLRPELLANWKPGMGMRYSDPDSRDLLAGVMDGCTWVANGGQAGVGWRLLVTAVSNGQVGIPSNTVGDGRSLRSGGPTVSGETELYQGMRVDVLEMHLHLSTRVPLGNGDQLETAGIVEPLPPRDVALGLTLAMYFTSQIVEPGSVVTATKGSGSVPVTYFGVLLTDEAVFTETDLFN